MKKKRATWFKLFLHQKALIDSVSNAVAGQALKACFAYFDHGEVQDMDPLPFAVFSAIKPYIDESIADYERSKADGFKGSRIRWGAGEDE